MARVSFVATVSFVSNVGGRKYRITEGDLVVLPKGADWAISGLVVPIQEPGVRQMKRRRPRAKKKSD